MSALKIKIVERKKARSRVEKAASRLRESEQPYTLRVKRDHGGGLWTFEGDDGQLYLAVKSREFAPIPRDAPFAGEVEYLKHLTAELGQPERVYRNSEGFERIA